MLLLKKQIDLSWFLGKKSFLFGDLHRTLYGCRILCVRVCGNRKESSLVFGSRVDDFVVYSSTLSLKIGTVQCMRTYDRCVERVNFFVYVFFNRTIHDFAGYRRT